MGFCISLFEQLFHSLYSCLHTNPATDQKMMLKPIEINRFRFSINGLQYSIIRACQIPIRTLSLTEQIVFALND